MAGTTIPGKTTRTPATTDLIPLSPDGNATAGSVAALPPAVTTQSGTTYTFALADSGTVVDFTNAAAVAATVPPQASVAYVVGAVLTAYAAGAAGVAIVAGAGVTIRNNISALIQYQEVSLRYDGSDVWVRVG